MTLFALYPSAGPAPLASTVGFRFGSRGTHTSRTLMFEELSLVLEATQPDARRADYAAAIIEANCLSKPTTATRRLSNQRLGELYALDAAVPVFRVLRKLWELDRQGRSLLALLGAIARDPLLAATTPAVAALAAGADWQRDVVKAALRAAVGERLNESILDKVVRNAASSWTQSGHLQGRTFKKRQTVHATFGSAAFAIFLAYAAGFRGADIFTSGWLAILDCSPESGRRLAIEAKQHSLLDLRMAADIVELRLDRLDPSVARY
jgi:hypothetical protein